MKKEIEEVPIWHKIALTVEETAKYSNIGTNQIRWMVNAPDCPFVLSVGKKKLIKRQAFEKFIDETSSIR